jgi:uncharacterized protein
MELSRYNILSKIHHRDEYFIVNLLSGQADILSPAEASLLMSPGALSANEYIEKGYVVDPKQEEKRFRQAYLDFLDTRETDEIQLFYVPTYGCNFSCSYCYQSGFPFPPQQNGIRTADAFFTYIQQAFSNRRKYVTLFGGEPLLNGNHHRSITAHFAEKCGELGLELAVVTNGFHLESYIPAVLRQATIREIQVTLDGPEHIHNRRRTLKNGKPTFREIIRGIDVALGHHMPVNLRVIVDRENIASLPELSRFAIEKGWTSSSLFKTQLGRNYELHYCQSGQDKLYSRIDLYKDLYGLIIRNPDILEFHRPAFSVSKFLFENGELPPPLFDACPGCKTEWAFDYTGKIFSCTATVGKPGEEVGTFFPNVSLNGELVEKWQQRDVLSIRHCAGCNLRLACGGGCASVALNNKGDLHEPDCRPVKELLEYGISLYSTINVTSETTGS